MSRADDVIFLLKKGRDSVETELEALPSTEYDREAQLQDLLDRHPQLLAGAQIRPEDPVRWLPVDREAGIPNSEGGSNYWAVDHLLLDQHGRPTLVEDKLSSNPELRRKVIGQMLEYAANVQFWSVDMIRSCATERHGGEELFEEVLLEFLQVDATQEATEVIEAYWELVSENLRQGNVRLLFVADRLPRELRRVIEFLNERMPHVEVLGVEIQQYKGDNLHVLVPRLVGQTEFARQEKRSSRRAEKLTRDGFMDSIPLEARDFFEDLFQQAQERGHVWEAARSCFVLRFHHPEAQLSTILYIFPPYARATHQEHAVLRFFMEYLARAGEDTATIRERLKAVAPSLTEQGKHTLHLDLKDETRDEAEAAIGVLFTIADEIMARSPEGVDRAHDTVNDV